MTLAAQATEGLRAAALPCLWRCRCPAAVNALATAARKCKCRLLEAATREEAYQETLLCVNRLWEELNAAIGFIQYRYGNVCACMLPPLLGNMRLACDCSCSCTLRLQLTQPATAGLAAGCWMLSRRTLRLQTPTCCGRPTPSWPSCCSLT
jgi:hypothetical protein